MLNWKTSYRIILKIFSSIFLTISFEKGYNIERKVVGKMSITATEWKLNLNKYLLLASEQDIYITQYGKVVAKLTSPFQERVDIAKSLFGVIPSDITLEEAKEERLRAIW